MRFFTVYVTLLYQLSPLVVNAFHCTDTWPDYCPPEGGQPTFITGQSNQMSHDAQQGVAEPCVPYAPPLPADIDLNTVRGNLINALFGISSGKLPANGADAVIPESPTDSSTSRGCWCSTLGNCEASACTWVNNKTRVVFTVRAPLANGTEVVLNSTAFWTLNTSGVAPSTYIGEYGPPDFASPRLPPLRFSDTVVIWHQGHNSPCDIPGGDADYDGVIDHINQLGFDVINLHMPTYQVNAAAPPFACNHSAFAPLEAAGVPVFRFFLEPAMRAVNFALEQGYSRVVFAGLSGGGWTTTLAAAIDPRISLSVSIAGSIPCDFAHTSWDYEQFCDRSWAQVANYTYLYALAALEESRVAVQVLHEQDPCCHHACGRHDRIRAYNNWVNNVTRGAFATVATAGAVHEVNPRDRTILGLLLGSSASTSREGLRALPFDLMHDY